MPDQHLFTPTGPRGTLRARPTLRTKSPSPSRPQRPSDELLSQLTPATAVEALQSPAGPLKTCLDRASASEQAFALKTAIASKMIHCWLKELSNWHWPSTDTSTGFEMPATSRRMLLGPNAPKDNHKDTPHPDVAYFGSLPAEDVIQYEKRIEQIDQDMEGLDLEEIKTQVLHNHILPLSRPGTPFSDAGLSITSAFSYAKMEDLTAVVTAITVRALPALSKLTRLLHTWSLRLVVLRKVPLLLIAITDAEVALLSGWSAIKPPFLTPDSITRIGAVGSSIAQFSQKDFNVIKTVLQQKVARPGRDLDFMLDTLEGTVDTLPEEWLDRMESIERDYAEWVTAAERKVREAEYSDSPMAIDTIKPVLPIIQPPNIQIQDSSPTTTPTSPEFSEHLEEDRESWAVRILADQSKKGAPKARSRVDNSLRHVAHRQAIDSKTRVKGPKPDQMRNAGKAGPTKSNVRNSPAIPFSTSRPKTTQEPRKPTYDGPDDPEDNDRVTQSPVLSEVNRNIVRQSADQLSKPETLLKPPFEEDFEPSILESVNEEDEEPELPPTYFQARKKSDPSAASMLFHDSSNYSPEYSDHGTFHKASLGPGLPHLRDPDEPFSSDAISPPSSPPLRYKPRSTSVTFKELPEIAPLPEPDDSPPRTPLERPAVFDLDTSFVEWESQLSSPSRMSTISAVSDDDHLQKQLRELLETIPAKIELKKRGINLNPPDFQPPSRPKTRHSEPSRRPTSALSSRAGSRVVTPSYSRSGTPSFMLAPVRDTRPRSTSSQGIRLYHLSRSGEMPIKLFIRCVGEQNERVMVRVGGGWSDLGEYLRDYAIHHGSRSKGEGKVEVTDAVPVANRRVGSSPSSRPGSSLGSPMTPLVVRKTRKNPSEEAVSKAPKTPLGKTSNLQEHANTPASEASVRSRASSRVDWDEEDSSLGLAGPKAARRREISEESRAWIESVKQKVRLASGDRIISSISSEQLRPPLPLQAQAQQKKMPEDRFGEIGKAGNTKRLFRKN
ncbi:putative GAS2 domain-containing protein [Rosellinia necatrix]|uniref:Putative GAS2 domain-containing protein n=1 Tax=Rosellinia necatrix TaxID=77044 RepID=A0A1S7ULU2_ROSNE|nr:putative GAS2 domain-containing protein [Rosellinia necatrix]